MRNRIESWFGPPEVIGAAECPLMLRWTLFNRWLKLLVHYFPPEVTDSDPHDHPRSFLTFILKGGYYNTEWVKMDPPLDLGNGETQDYLEEIEYISRGALIYRPANHMHIVETGGLGCWSIVVMGPISRPWGFLRSGRWIPWKRYVDMYGGTIRCEDGTHVPPAEQAVAADYKGTPPPPVPGPPNPPDHSRPRRHE